MRAISCILFLSFTLGILIKADIITFAKKVKSALVITSSSETDEESRTSDDDNTKEDKNKEIEDKNTPPLYSTLIAEHKFNCNKHILSFFKIKFKTNFQEIVTPPPELI